MASHCYWQAPTNAGSDLLINCDTLQHPLTCSCS